MRKVLLSVINISILVPCVVFGKECGDVDLSINYFNTNWWHISSLDIEFDVIEENGEWYVNCGVQLKEPTEDFEIITSNKSRKIKLDEINNSVLSIGP